MRRRLRVARVVPVLAPALLLGACLAGPPAGLRTPDGAPADAATVVAATVHSPAREVVEAAPAMRRTLRGGSPERAARAPALRVRALGCRHLATGSGVAVDERLLVTNRHVVADAHTVELSTWDGVTVTTVEQTAAFGPDLALVRTTEPLPHVAPLAAADPAPDTPANVVGFPHGGAQTVRGAQVVAVTPGGAFGEDGPVLQLVADGVAPGSSGGPVLDTAGRLLGVVYGLETAAGHVLALPASTLHGVLADEASLLPAVGSAGADADAC